MLLTCPHCDLRIDTGSPAGTAERCPRCGGTYSVPAPQVVTRWKLQLVITLGIATGCALIAFLVLAKPLPRVGYMPRRPAGSPVSRPYEMEAVGYRLVETACGYATVAWQVRVTNRTEHPRSFSVECSFRDADDFELERALARTDGVCPGGTGTVSKQARMTTSIWLRVHHVQVKVKPD